MLDLKFSMNLGLAQIAEARGERSDARALAMPLLESWEKYGEHHTLIELHLFVHQVMWGMVGGDDVNGAILETGFYFFQVAPGDF